MAGMALLLAFGGCASAPRAAPPACQSAPTEGTTLYVVNRGWHTELGVPASALMGPLSIFRAIYPGARMVMFGYGKRTFMTARADRASEYLLGPFPGPAVIEAIGLRVLAPSAYGPGGILALSLPPGGAAQLSDFIWRDLVLDHTGAPLLVGPGKFAGSRFYAARSGYSLTHTCNSWVADALAAAGVPMGGGVVPFSGQVMARAAAAGLCLVGR